MTLESLLPAILASCLVALSVWALTRWQASATLQQLKVANEQLQQQAEQLQDEADMLRDQSLSLQQEQGQLQVELGRLQTRAEERDQTLQQYQTWWQQEQQRYQQLQAEFQQLQSEHSALSSRREQQELHFREQLRQLEQSRELLKKEFEQLAAEILERKGKAFTQMSEQSLNQLLNPIQHEMKGFREKVEHIHLRETEQRVQLRTELQNLQQLNKAITDQAEKLTTALQGQKKVQGNWGELMLENVLDNAGLRLGHDYRREVSINTEEGRQRPDAIVYLPGDKHLIIDAKTSLAAYTRYVNAEQESERQQALREHARAVSDRIKELAERRYDKLPGLNSPEIVIMFIPVESAYVEALKADETLYQRALEQNVLVATPTTLLTSLNIVRQLWRFEDQSRHTAELAERAEKFYNKLNSFLTSMQDVGKKLDGARASYDRAFAQLYSGRGNLIKQAAEFKDLGVSVQKELPAELVDKARLELDSGA
ncbi:DNA recombination protein RmuC [Marinobacterium sediminicola]|uniref:DNA recombination protein RmuC n=1 Tax=Marinobacterium sediminicola TaxID=518898 RepID=A0ABY1S4I6_9GAMM|nr:DNA recombination protein RmuC [Marinobacterium sediminicola]ULG70112.1 DNA recombination protein RmuC [Marinobacterium sediminicola]SMR78387.1 DNA recombination protein RmuC [Marinobacterium sediminicola]